MPVKNEDWILGLSLRAVLAWVDEVVVGLHACTDGSAEIVAAVADEYSGRVHVITQDNPVWSEMAHRQALLDRARAAGATHIAIVDADEVLTGNLIPHVRGIFESLNEGAIFQPPWVCLARSIDRYYTSGPWFNNWVSMGFRDAPWCHWQARDGYDFHHRHPMGGNLRFERPVMQSPAPNLHSGGLMHLQFVSERRLRAKQALYKVTELLRWPGREPVQVVDERYNLAVYESDPGRTGAAVVPAEWWGPYRHLLDHLHVDAEPWQEVEVRKAWQEYGAAKFRGLDLFGVAS